MRKKQSRKILRSLLTELVLVTFLLILIAAGVKLYDAVKQGDSGLVAVADGGQKENGEIPKELLALAEENPEIKDFVMSYPQKKDKEFEIDLSEYKDCDEVPLFLQWDERWGYSYYGDNVMGISGCGPTCLSMVCVYLLGDVDLHPRYVAEFSEEKGYYVSGSGSSWSLIFEGGKELGLDVTEITPDEDRVMRNLELGNPIICSMRPGDFTSTGHFVVLVGCEDGKIKINDPNSMIRSEQLWNFEDIKYQIKNLWVCRKGEN
ncbi:MAG: C39 family peptidase [Lachnospiraceae bacterium]|nr:C39 family peptidase [Lachnospiraceae bacterium]